MGGILNQNLPVIIGRTRLINNIEEIIWEKIECNNFDTEKSLLEAPEELNITEYSVIENIDCQLAMTGKAF